MADRAGWHITHELKVPKNITLVLLPAKSPELNPVGNVWQYMRQNWLSKRGCGIDGRNDGFVIGNLLANFCHLRDTDQYRWAARFVAFVRTCKESSHAPPQPVAAACVR